MVPQHLLVHFVIMYLIGRFFSSMGSLIERINSKLISGQAHIYYIFYMTFFSGVRSCLLKLQIHLDLLSVDNLLVSYPDENETKK